MRIMVFVDGSNFLRQLGRFCGGKIITTKPKLDVLSKACEIIRQLSFHFQKQGNFVIMRRYWFGSYTGNAEDQLNLSKTLHEYDFNPILFHTTGGREKRVDIALSKEMLVNAANQYFDIGLLFSGDEDYVELVNEVKRHGRVVKGVFFDEDYGLS